MKTMTLFRSILCALFALTLAPLAQGALPSMPRKKTALAMPAPKRNAHLIRVWSSRVKSDRDRHRFIFTLLPLMDSPHCDAIYEQVLFGDNRTDSTLARFALYEHQGLVPKALAAWVSRLWPMTHSTDRATLLELSRKLSAAEADMFWRMAWRERYVNDDDSDHAVNVQAYIIVLLKNVVLGRHSPKMGVAPSDEMRSSAFRFLNDIDQELRGHVQPSDPRSHEYLLRILQDAFSAIEASKCIDSLR